jgi:hypothetical protein
MSRVLNSNILTIYICLSKFSKKNESKTRKTFKKLQLKSEKEGTVENSIPDKNLSSIDKAMNNLIKMKKVTKLLKASAPIVRKYAWLGHYKEYRFGEKLVSTIRKKF